MGMGQLTHTNQVGAVGFRRAGTDGQQFGDGRVSVPFQDELKHITLAVGGGAEGIQLPLLLIRPVLVHDTPGHTIVG